MSRGLPYHPASLPLRVATSSLAVRALALRSSPEEAEEAEEVPGIPLRDRGYGNQKG